MGDDAGEPLGSTSVFPPPPSVYQRFTEENCLWFDVLRGELRKEGKEDAYHSLDVEERKELQDTLLKQIVAREGGDGLELPTDDLHELLPPNVHWIEEDGGYQLFGQRWPIPEVTPSLQDLGITRLFPEEPFDRARALQTLLRTLLHTYFMLTSDLLRPIQPYDVLESGGSGGGHEGDGAEAPGQGGEHGDGPPAQDGAQDGTQDGTQDGAPAGPTWTTSTRIKDRLKHLEVAVINFQFLVNQLRPVQARASLEALLTMQVARRERQTKLLREKSAAIRLEIAKLQL